MRYWFNPVRFLAAVLLLFISALAQAENSSDFGDFVVHYNAFNTDILSPKVAQEYGIKRSQNRGMLNVVVLRKVLGSPGQPVSAKISGMTTNLTGSHNPLEFREIREPNAIYYVAEFGVTNEEILVFNVDVEVEGSDETMSVRYRKQFFTH